MSNVGYATLSIIPSTKGFQTALASQVGVAGAPVGKDVGKKAGKGFGAGFLPIATKAFAPLAAAGGVLAAGKFLTSSIGAASDYAETINAVKVAYQGSKGAAEGILALGKTSATTFGLTATQLNEFAVRFSGFAATAAGKGGNVAGTFEKIAARATDFASVMNLDVNEAAQLFQSGLAGETEPLRRFGIDMSAAAVETFAYANGIGKAGEKLTEAQKVQARYGLLMKQTNKVQGDFKNTSNGLANQQRILGARFGELKTTIGTALLPIATKFVSFLNGVMGKAIPFVTGLIDKLSGKGGGGGLSFLTPIIASVKQGVAELQPLVKQLATAFVGWMRAIMPVVAWLAKAVGWILGKVIPVVVKLATIILGNVIRALTGFYLVAAKVVEWVKKIPGAVSGAIDWMRQLPGKIKGAVSDAGRWLYEAGKDVMAGLARGIKDGLTAPLRTVKEGAGSLIDAAKRKLGISSPSRVFAELGVWTMKGLALGVNRSAGLPASAVSAAAAAMIPAVPGPLAASSSASPLSGGGGPAVAKLYLDGRQVAEAVFDAGGREYAYGRTPGGF